jgi:ankyrin repeat protein
LWIAAQNGHVELVSQLLKKGADPNTLNVDGVSAIWQASNRGHADVVQLLLKHGADLKRTWRGASPLFVACQEVHSKVALILLDNGADVSAVNDSLPAPLWMAAANGMEQVVEQMLVKGAKADIRATNGTSAVCVAMEKGHDRIVEALVRAGAPEEEDPRYFKCPGCAKGRIRKPTTPPPAGILPQRCVCGRLMAIGWANGRAVIIG